MAVLLKPYGSTEWEKTEFAGLAEVTGVNGSTAALTEDEICRMIENVTILQADVDISVTRSILKRAKNLRAVLCTSMGYDYVDLKAASECGIVVANNPEFCVVAVAEYAIGLMFALMRRIPEGVSAVKDNKWGQRSKLGGFELTGKTLGIVGLGKTGREVAVRARGLGMTVLAYSPNAGLAAAESSGAKLVTLEELLSCSDIITIHTSLRKDTRELLGENEFNQMKKSAYIINVARGGIINEEALIAALQKDIIAGAALDVLANEPSSPNNPLLKMENVLITPHVAWYTAEAKEKIRKTYSEQVRLVLQGSMPPHVLNPEVIPKWKGVSLVSKPI